LLTKELEGTIQKMNVLGSTGEPFFFAIDFDAQKPVVIPLDELAAHNIQLVIDEEASKKEAVAIRPKPFPIQSYFKQIKKVQDEILYGNSFLCNLTAETPIETELSLAELFDHAVSKYKLLFKDEWLCFSPETFVEMKDNMIYSYPMKGTIDAKIANAEAVLLNDKKEIAEHYTIVDLIRNDLSMVATNVKVDSFRFISEIKTAKGKLLQASSKISGELPDNWQAALGSIFCKLLPAGSITGAPKMKTVEIIKEAENYNRGFYTGVAGVFDGNSLNSCVLIRFIEKTKDGLVYKSGGGITKYSEPIKEYGELIQKIYVPTT